MQTLVQPTQARHVVSVVFDLWGEFGRNHRCQNLALIFGSEITRWRPEFPHRRTEIPQYPARARTRCSLGISAVFILAEQTKKTQMSQHFRERAIVEPPIMPSKFLAPMNDH